MTGKAVQVNAAAEVAATVEARIREQVKVMRSGWMRLAEDLYRFHHLEMWRDLGYETFEVWLAGPDIGLSRRHVYGLVEAWRELVVNRGVAPKELERVTVGSVREVLPAVRLGLVDVGDALSDCEALGRMDLRERYVTITGGGGDRIDATREDTFERCPTCGTHVPTDRLKAAA